MIVFFGIILALFVFSCIVFFHELGHFLAARRTGVKVEEFGLGIPPRALKLWTDRKGTLYTLNWLPIGGFVRLKWEDKITAKGADSFAAKGYFSRSLILLAGVSMNFILAWFIFVGLFWHGTNPNGIAPIGINDTFKTKTESLLVPTHEQAIDRGILQVDGVVVEPLENSPAERAGLKKNDVITHIDGQKIVYPADLSTVIQKNPKSLTFSVERSNAKPEEKEPAQSAKPEPNIEHLQITVSPENWKIGIVYGPVEHLIQNFVYSYGFVDSLGVSAREVYSQSYLTLELLGNLVHKLVMPATPQERTEATKSLSGPIGIGNLFVSLVDMHVPVSVIIAIAALISLNLGVFNLLPFPALDGGRFAFLTIHTVLSKISSGRWGTDRLEARANLIGFALLLLMSIFVAYQDIVRIVFGH